MSVRITIIIAVLLGPFCASVWAGPPSSVDVMEKRLGHKVTIPELVKSLQDKDEHLRQRAAGALLEFGPDAREAVSPLIEALKDESADVRGTAAVALGQIGSSAKPGTSELIKALKDPEWYVRSSAAFALGKIGAGAKPAVPALVEALKDKEDDVRYAAVEALSEMGPPAGEAVSALRELARSGWREPVSALGKIGPMARAAIPELTKMLNDQPAKAQSRKDADFEKQDITHNRIAAALALWQIDHQSKVIPVLMEILQDKDHQYTGNLFHVREYAAGALWDIGSEAKAAVPLLIEALNDENYRVRKAAAGALGAIGKEAQASAPALGKLVREDNYVVGQEAADALGKMGPSAKVALPDLMRAAQPNKNFAPLKKGWGRNTEPLRVAAARAIWRIDRQADLVIPALVEALSIESIPNPTGPRFFGLRAGASLRRSAAEALADMGESAKDALPALKAVATNDDFLSVREAATTAIKRIDRADNGK